MNDLCKHWNARKEECDKGAYCDCARDVANEGVVDLSGSHAATDEVPFSEFGSGTQPTIVHWNGDKVVIPFKAPVGLKAECERLKTQRKNASKPAKGIKNFIIGCLIVWAVVLIVWALL